MKLLDLPDSPRTKVFRLLVAIVENDPIIVRLVGRNLYAWTGEPTDAIDLTQAGAPAIRISPTHAPDNWRFPEAWVGDLFINFEILVPGTCADDLMNFWWAVLRAIYPIDRDRKLANVRALNEAGAFESTPIITFTPSDPAPNSDMLHAVGQMRIQVREQLNA